MVPGKIFFRKKKTLKISPTAAIEPEKFLSIANRVEQKMFE